MAGRGADPSLRILHIVPVVSHTGIWRHLQAAQHIAAGVIHECVEIFGAPNQDSGPLSMRVTKLNIAKAAHRDIEPIVEVVAATAEKFHADLIHSYHVLSDVYAGRAALRLGLPMIRTVAGVAQTNWSDTSDPPSVHTAWGRADIAEELAVEPAVHTTLAVSDAVRKMLGKAGLPHSKTRTSYLGTAAPVAQHPRVLRADEITIGFPHRIEPVKLGPTFVPALRKLRDKGIGIHVVLVRSGNCFEEFAHALRGLVSLQVVPVSADMWRAMPPMDCVVLDSLTEGVPLILLEGMARGLPIIAAKVGGVPEAITDGRDGLLFESGDVTALVGAILRLMQDPALGRDLGEAARDTITRKFNLASHLAQLEHVYREAFRAMRL